MTRIVIVEDEGVAARRITRMLESLGLEVIHHSKSLENLEHYLSKNEEPDLYLMDIHLSDGIIFEIFEKIELKSPIIFTTAYDQYAIKAFKQNSVDYLLKPIQEDDLKVAIEKYEQIYRGSTNSSVIDMLAISKMIESQRKGEVTYRERIRVKVGDHIKSIKLDEVTQIFSESKLCFIQTKEGRKFPIDQTLESMYAELNPKRFFRVSRSRVVQIDFIEDVVSYSNSRLKVVVLNGGKDEIVVARDRVKDFKQWLG